MWPHSARPKQRNNRPIAASIGLVAAVLAVLAFGVLAPGEPSLAAGSGTWTTYHHDARRSGVDPDQTPFSSVSFDWSVPVDGDVYAQPLVWNGHVYVATEENTVFAFDATTGQSVWTQKLGAAVPSTVVPNGCANATPHLGVTSTPVIDPATARMYLVAQEDSPLRYELWTLDLNNGGAPISRQTIDPWPGTPQQQATQNALEVQRGALLLANGYVYVNFGGRAECGQAANTLPDYHGWVVAVPIAGQAGGNKSIEFPLPTGRGAGIWSPGGASLGQGGQVYVATGNSLQQATFDNGESVVKLSPTLDLLDFWAPSDWAALNAGDFDIGSFTPTQLDNGIIFQGGKTGFGYLLRDSALGHIGGQAFVSPQHICGTAVPRSFNTGTWVAPLLYMSCTDGIKALRVTTTGTVGFSKIWDGPVAGYPGSAIFAGGALWYTDAPSHNFFGLDALTGAVRFQFTLPTVPQHFATPSSGNGRIYAASFTRLTAFRLTPSAPPATSTPTATNTPLPAPTATSTPTATNTPVPAPTATDTPVPAPTATSSPPTPTPQPETQAQSATATPTSAPTATSTPGSPSSSGGGRGSAPPPVPSGGEVVGGDVGALSSAAAPAPAAPSLPAAPARPAPDVSAGPSQPTAPPTPEAVQTAQSESFSVALAGVRPVGSLQRLALDGRASGEMLFPVANLSIVVPADSLGGRSILAEGVRLATDALPALPAGFSVGSSSVAVSLLDATSGASPPTLAAPLMLTWQVNADDVQRANGALDRVRWAAWQPGGWQALPCAATADASVLTCSVANPGLLSVLIAPPPAERHDFDVPNGHFFQQTNGFGGAGSLGYGVIDDADAAFWTEFQRLGGVEIVGYPVSERFQHKGFLTQAFQKLALQWRPDLNQVVVVNVLDDLNQIGSDGWLDRQRQVPPAADTSGDSGLSTADVIDSHMKLLDAYPELAVYYAGAPDALEAFGLPLAVKDYGPFVAVRLQRATLQLWTVDTPSAAAGTVVAGNAADIAKEAGLWPPEATIPRAPQT